MKPICILTDNTVQFPKPLAAGQNIEIIPLKTVFNNSSSNPTNKIELMDLPVTADEKISFQLIPPSIEEFTEIFLTLSHQYNKLVGIFMSGQLNPAFDNALKASQQLHGKVAIEIIDSQTTSMGLGYLVQLAASAAVNGIPSSEIERAVRIMIPYVYTVFCIPDLSYLYYSGFVDRAQAAICSMQGLYPIFTLENGKLIPLEKVRNLRHASTYLQEFLDEFDNIQLVSFLQSYPSITQESKFLHEFIQENHPGATFSEIDTNLPLATLLGPQSFGLLVVESQNHKNR